MPYVDWRIKGPEIAACNCDWGCPCQFNALPTHGDCRASVAMEIEEGHFGNVALDGVRWAAVFAWPGAVHEGGGEALVVVDSRADEAQRDAVLKILSGAETEPGATVFNVFASTLTNMHEPRFAEIEFHADIEARRGSFRVVGVTDTEATPIINPVTGQEHRARVTLPHGFEYQEAEYASSRVRTGDPIPNSWDQGHCHLAYIDMTAQGPVR